MILFGSIQFFDIFLAVRSEDASRPHIENLVSSLSSSHAPQTRSQTKAKAETRLHESTKPVFFQTTPLNTLFTDGMNDEQIWAQLDLRTQTICRILDYVLEAELTSPDISSNQGDSVEEDNEEDDRLQKALEALKRDEDTGLDEFLAEYGLHESDLDDSQDDDDLNNSSPESDGEEEEMQEDISPLRDPSSSEDETEYLRSAMKPSRKRKRGESSELDDGFFDLAEFNAYTERAEAKSSSRGRLGGDDSDEDEQEIDLFANVDPNVDWDDDGKAGQGMYYRFH
jgi:U3 small nucleolar RNA-associated protein MPP10